MRCAYAFFFCLSLSRLLSPCTMNVVGFTRRAGGLTSEVGRACRGAHVARGLPFKLRAAGQPRFAAFFTLAKERKQLLSCYN